MCCAEGAVKGCAGQLGLLVVALQSLVVEGGHSCEPPFRSSDPNNCQSGCQSNFGMRVITPTLVFRPHSEDNMCHVQGHGGYRPLCESTTHPIEETCPNAITAGRRRLTAGTTETQAMHERRIGSVQGVKMAL